MALGGGGAWFDMFQPVMVVTKIIYAGAEAMGLMAMGMEAMPMTIEGRDELAVLRQEMEQLRLLVGLRAPGRQRALSAPMSGTH